MEGATPTVGFLTFDTSGTYNNLMWRGILRSAAAMNWNSITFCGGMLFSSDQMFLQWNRIFDLAATGRIDALIVLSGSISHYSGPDRLSEFLKRFVPIPMVSIGLTLPGLSSVVIDNEVGMRDVVRHMLIENKVRRPLFLKGPDNNSEAISRFASFRAVMEEERIPIVPDLVRMADFRLDIAESVMEDVIRSGAEFDAVIASNDDMALGAMEVLRRHGYAVPERVVVSGFDDTELSQYGTVPLTTVRQPADKMAEAAMLLASELMKGRAEEKVVMLPAELVVRKSCGCLNVKLMRDFIGVAAVGVGDASGATTSGVNPLLSPVFSERCARLSAAIGTDRWRETLWDAMTRAVADNADANLLLFLDSLVRKSDQAGLEDLNLWHEALGLWRMLAVPAYRGNAAQIAFLEDFFQKARMLIAEIRDNQQAYARKLIEQRDFMLLVFSVALFQITTLNQFIAHLAKELPKFGITDCFISLFEKSEDERSRSLMSFQAGGGQTWSHEGALYPTLDILPPQYAIAGRYDLVMEPLLDSEDIIGFMGFRIREALDMMENIRQSVSNALVNAILVQEVRKDRRLKELLSDLEQKQRQLEQAYESLKSNQETLLIAEKMASLGKMTAGIAHEMNTPIAAIRAFFSEMNSLIAELDQSIGDPEVTPDDIREILREFRHSCGLAEKAAEQTAAFVHSIKSQTRDLDPKDRFRFNAVAVIRDSVLLLGHVLKHGRCELAFSPQSEYMELFGAPGRLAQVITNLVTNSVDACVERQGGTIRIGLRFEDETAVLSVEDNGSGISSGNMTRIFDPMFTTKPFGVGTGLGLTLVHNIVTGEFGGKVDVESRLGQGTKFHIRFPKIKEAPLGQKI